VKKLEKAISCSKEKGNILKERGGILGPAGENAWHFGKFNVPLAESPEGGRGEK